MRQWVSVSVRKYVGAVGAYQRSTSIITSNYAYDFWSRFREKEKKREGGGSKTNNRDDSLTRCTVQSMLSSVPVVPLQTPQGVFIFFSFHSYSDLASDPLMQNFQVH